MSPAEWETEIAKNTENMLKVKYYALVYDIYSFPRGLRKALNKKAYEKMGVEILGIGTGVIFLKTDVNQKLFEDWLLEVLPENGYVEVAEQNNMDENSEIFIITKHSDKLDKIKLAQETTEKLNKVRDDFLIKQEDEDSVRERRDYWWGIYTGFDEIAFLHSTSRSITKKTVTRFIKSIKDDDTMILDTGKILDSFLLEADGVVEKLNESQRAIDYLTDKTWIIVDEGIEQFYTPRETLKAAKLLGLKNIAKMMQEYIVWLESFGAKDSLDEVEINDDERWDEKIRGKERQFSSDFVSAWEKDKAAVVIREYISKNIKDFIGK